MKIEFYSKNWAKIKDTVFEAGHVPRVGELIEARHLLDIVGGEPEYFFVTKVIYQASANELLPVVTCRQWVKGSREQELMERGWLPGWPGDVTHDDD